jgi:hypothetical protein
MFNYLPWFFWCTTSLLWYTYVQLSPLIFLMNNLFGMIYICSIISLDFSDEQPLWYDIHMLNYLPWFFWRTTSLVWYTYIQLSPLIFLTNHLFGMIYIYFSSEKSREIIEHMHIISKRLFIRKIKGDNWIYVYHTKEVVRQKNQGR